MTQTAASTLLSAGTCAGLTVVGRVNARSLATGLVSSEEHSEACSEWANQRDADFRSALRFRIVFTRSRRNLRSSRHHWHEGFDGELRRKARHLTAIAAALANHA
jgi:hypothetical protein